VTYEEKNESRWGMYVSITTSGIGFIHCEEIGIETVLRGRSLCIMRKVRINQCCMCTCIVSLTAQVGLICSWCMKICLRRAANISANGYANEYRYGYGYRRLVCIHTRLLASRRSVNQEVCEASKVTTRPYVHRC
jgi:hypothetical protein